MERKTFPTASTKVIDEARGIVEHVITIFGVLDLVKDISHPGSWTKTLAERGDKLLVLDMHNTDSINRAIGTPIRVWEVGRSELPPEVLADYPEATGGVKAQTQLLLDTPEGKGAYIRLRDKAVREWSYGYDALDVDRSVVKNKEGDDVSVRNLRTVKVYEYGPVLWGACPGTMVTDVKEMPDEEKPAPDVTENTIRIRVRDPGDFQEDSFRTITIGDEDDGIQAVIGRLEGETTTTTQSFIFDKEKFTTAEAQAWVDEHEKQAPVIYTCECLECGHTMESEEHCRDIECPSCGNEMRRVERPGVGSKATEDLPLSVDEEETDAKQGVVEPDEEGQETDSEKTVDLIQGNHSIVPLWDDAEKAIVRTAFEAQYKTPSDPSRYWIVAAHDEHIIVQHDGAVDGIEFYQVGYTKTEDAITFTPQGEWIGGEYIFVPRGTEEKAGRVLAGRNETRIIGALLTLIEVLDDAGLELPGFEQSPVIVAPEEEANAPKAPQSLTGAQAASDSEAGPTESPTLTELVRREEAKNLVDWLKEQVELLATLSKEVT